MDNFVAREYELSKLQEAWDSGRFEFAIVYGRRRVGKTCLLERFTEEKRGVWYQAKRGGGNLALLSEVVGRFTQGVGGVRYNSYSSLLDVLAKEAEKERMYFVIDEISFLDGDKGEPDLLSLFQYYVDIVFKKTKLMLIFCGSSRSFMERQLLADPSPLYGRNTLLIHLMPFFIEESAKMLPSSWSVRDIAAGHVISSGIPYYESFLCKYPDLESALRAEYFSPGTLSSEPLLYLMSEFRAVESYNKVLGSLAQGVTEVGRISDRTGLTSSNISKMLSVLEYQGLVKRKEKFMGKGNGRGWRLSDGFFAFYYRFVYESLEDIQLRRGQAAADEAVGNLDAFIGRHIERDFRFYVQRRSEESVKEIGQIDFPDPETHRNEELDLAARTKSYVIFGECKWEKGKTGMAELETLQKRASLVAPDLPKRYFLLSLSGFTDELSKEAEGRDDLELVTGEQLLSFPG